ncbi:MAG: hypothetical protein RLZZ630_2028 [Bacteroidota bacterium]
MQFIEFKTGLQGESGKGKTNLGVYTSGMTKVSSVNDMLMSMVLGWLNSKVQG